jgi:hypothetical protein
MPAKHVQRERAAVRTGRYRSESKPIVQRDFDQLRRAIPRLSDRSYVSNGAERIDSVPRRQ